MKLEFSRHQLGLSDLGHHLVQGDGASDICTWCGPPHKPNTKAVLKWDLLGFNANLVGFNVA